MRPAAICTEWKPIGKNSLIGAAKIEFPSGMVMDEVLVFQAAGRRWAMPPGRPMVDAAGVVLRDANGKPRYVQLIDFVDKAARSRWSDAVIAAVRAAFPEALETPRAEPRTATTEGARDDDMPF